MTSTSDESLLLAQTVLLQGQLKLDAQLRLTIAAMQRATTMVAVLSTVSIAALTLAMNEEKVTASTYGLVVFALVFIISAAFCAWSVRPRPLYTAGNRPERWWGAEVKDRPLAACLTNESKNYDTYIVHNRRILENDAWWFCISEWLAIASPLCGLIAWRVALAVVA